MLVIGIHGLRSNDKVFTLRAQLRAALKSAPYADDVALEDFNSHIVDLNDKERSFLVITATSPHMTYVYGDVVQRLGSVGVDVFLNMDGRLVPVQKKQPLPQVLPGDEVPREQSGLRPQVV